MTENELPDKLREKYLFKHPLGRGGAETFCIQNRSTGELWVLKIFEKQSYESKYIEELRLVFQSAQKVSNPGIEKIEDIEETEQYLFIVQEYLRGKTLSEMVKKEGAFQPGNVILFGRQLLRTVQELRQCTPPVLVRVMMPDDIICMDDGSIKLCNIGWVITFDSVYKKDFMCSLPINGFSAPEEYSGLKHIDERTDIFHIGMILFYIVLGVDPRKKLYYNIDRMFLAEHLAPSYSQKTAELIWKCIIPKPGKDW